MADGNVLRRPKVSVCLATFNGAAYLAEQLDSLARQTAPPDELVVSDDASTDDTMAVLERFAARAPFPVRLHANALNIGYADNFLRAAAMCRGDYIAFCDQDDVWRPTKLEVCLATLERTQAVLCVHTATLVDSRLQPIDRFPQGIREEGLTGPLQAPPMITYYGFTQVFRRTLLEHLPPEQRPEDNLHPGRRMAHDRWITVLANVFGTTATLPEPLVLYRQHPANASGPQRRVRRRDALQRILRLASPEHQQHLATAMAELAELLAQAASALTPEAACAAERAAAYYAGVSETYHQRERLYASPRLWGRARLLAQALEAGHYRDFQTGGLGRNILVKDALHGVLALGRHAIVSER